MSAGFGFSAGDFLAALKLVGTVIDALRESRGSSAVYRDLLNELLTLETALLQVKRLDIDGKQRTEYVALHQAASQCQGTIDDFWNKIRTYQPHLSRDGTGSRMADSWFKIKWAICKKDDVDKFKADLRGHVGAIEVLLLTVQVRATTLQATNQKESHQTLAGMIQSFSSQWLGRLSVVADGVNQTVEQGKQLLESTAKIVQTNLRVFQMVFDIQQFILQVPSQVNRQQPVYMIDAFGKESPFHLEFVRSAEALIAILKVNFKSTRTGPQMIERGDFVIEDDGTRRDVDLAHNWDTCFYPGQRVSMSMVFHRTSTSSCPSCGYKSTCASDENTICQRCGVTFRRVIDKTQETHETLPPLHPEFIEERDRMLSDMSIPGPLSLKRRRSSSGSEKVDDARQFRRLRLINLRPRCKFYTHDNNAWFVQATGHVRAYCSQGELWIEVRF